MTESDRNQKQNVSSHRRKMQRRATQVVEVEYSVGDDDRHLHHLHRLLRSTTAVD